MKIDVFCSRICDAHEAFERLESVVFLAAETVKDLLFECYASVADKEQAQDECLIWFAVASPPWASKRFYIEIPKTFVHVGGSLLQYCSQQSTCLSRSS